MFSLFQEYEHFSWRTFRQNKNNLQVVIILYISIGIIFELIYFLAYHGEMFQNFWETTTFLFISLVARYNQYEIYWIFFQGIIDIQKIKDAITMTKDMFTIKPMVNNVTFERFKKTRYYAIYQKQLDQRYTNLGEQHKP